MSSRNVGFDYMEAGEPWSESKGHPVVLIHGLGVNRHVWNKWVIELAQSNPVLKVDMRGHNDSKGAWSSASPEFDDFVDDVVDVIDTLKLERYHIIGESFGGTVALGVASRLSQSVASVATFSTGWKGAWINQVSTWETLLSKHGIGAWSDELTAGRFDPEQIDPRLAEWVGEAQRLLQPEVVWGIAKCLLGVDLTDELGSIKCPVLSAQGTSPFVDPRNTTELLRVLPQADLIKIPRSRHGIIMSHSRQCLDAAKGLISRAES